MIHMLECVSNKLKNVNIKVYDMALEVNQYELCKFKCRLNETACNPNKNGIMTILVWV